MGSMTGSHEFEGSSVEEAIKKALRKLNVSRETLDVKVIFEGEGGLFGMEGSQPTKIRVKIKK